MASACAALAIAASGTVAAQPAERPTKARRSAQGPSRPRALPLAAALVPGVLLHGAGHYAAGERGVARRLFAMEGIGLGLVAAGGVPLVATGASRHYSGPPIAAVVSGVGLFAMSWLADLYGTARGGAEGTAEPGAPLEVEAGYGYVRDPHFDYRQFAVIDASVRWGPNRLSPSAWLAFDDDNQRLRLEAARRFAGAGSPRPTGDASTFELTAAVTHHRYPGDGFAVTTGEASFGGRLDMARLGDSLGGSFAELALGLGAELTNYYRPGAGADLGEILLVRFGYGLAFGRPAGVNGEASLYYDHRRDTLTGGLSPGNGPGSGFAGFFGADVRLDIGPRWGARVQLEQGAATVAHVGLIARFGGSP